MSLTLTTALTLGAMRLAHLPTARRDAELLLLHATGRDRAFLLTHPDTALTSDQQSTYDQWLARRAQHARYIL